MKLRLVGDHTGQGRGPVGFVVQDEVAEPWRPMPVQVAGYSKLVAGWQ